MASAADSRDIHITRIYDAPLDRVWEAWTDPSQIVQWWGPRGFRTTTHERDLRTNGIWRYTMHGPDGKDWPNFTRYLEVVPRARLVYDHGATDQDAAPMFRVVALFTAIGDTTQLDITMTLRTAEDARQTRQFVRDAGGNATWDRLAEHLEQRQSQQEIFVVVRTFDAPIEQVFDAWTNPAVVAEWLPPTGFTMSYRRADVRAGGESFYSMTNGEFTMYGGAAYHLVRRPDRLEYSQWFADADECVSRHPGAPTWPERMRTVVTFAAEGAAATRVTVRWSVEGGATAEEIAAFVEERGGMTRGWGGSFDKLEAVLSRG